MPAVGLEQWRTGIGAARDGAPRDGAAKDGAAKDGAIYAILFFRFERHASALTLAPADDR